MPIEKHTINIIFFPILYFFFLNKNSESKIAMSIIVIRYEYNSYYTYNHIPIYFEFVNYAVITNGSAGNAVKRYPGLLSIFISFFLTSI